MQGTEPTGTLECPEGFVLDPGLNMCVPENMTQADLEYAAPFKPSGKMERCITSVKINLRKRKNMKSEDLKSVAIAICRNRLKQ